MLLIGLLSLASLTFTFRGSKIDIPIVDGKYYLSYPCDSNKETCFPYESDFPPGTYRFTVHGAGGGSYYSGYESPGGFSTGVLKLKEKTHLYFYVGAKGVCVSESYTKTTSVFGGGGNGYNGAGGKACSGGGASDVRVLKDSLNTRIIVSGGAGGTGYWNKYMLGGKGGGESGTKGDDYDSSSSSNVGGGPGNQTSGGTSPYNDRGVFGYGGNRSSSNGAGGGGGWFGGGAGGGSCDTAGGGGSGFIFTKLNSLIDLDSKFLLSENAETSIGSNTEDGKIYIEVLEMRPERSNKPKKRQNINNVER